MLEGGGNSCEDYPLFPVERNGVEYLVVGNAWNIGAGEQCISVNEGTFMTIVSQTGSSTAPEPSTYPSIIYGTKGTDSSAGANLPKRLGDLTSVRTHWSHNGGLIDGTYNAAYDIWFSSTENGRFADGGGAFFMLWFAREGSIQPAGSSTGEYTDDHIEVNIQLLI